MKKIIYVLGILMLMMMSMVSATSGYDEAKFRVNEQKRLSYDDLNNTQNQERLQEMLQIAEQVREQVQSKYNMSCDNCSYQYREEFEDQDITKRVMTEEKKGKFLGMSVTMRQKYTLNEDNQIEKRTQNFFAFLNRFGLVRGE
jgi:hypothetical protein